MSHYDPRASGSRNAVVKNNTGLLLVTCAQACFAAANVPVKLMHELDPPVTTLQLVWIRMAITYVCCILYMFGTGVPSPVLGPRGVRMLLALRGLSGFFGIFGVYFALQYLSLADATVLTFLSPLTTGFAGAYFLGERFTWRQLVAAIVSLFGVVLIARPPLLFGRGGLEGHELVKDATAGQRVLAVMVSLLGVLGATGAFTTIRAIGKQAHMMHILACFALWCVLASTAGLYITDTPLAVPQGHKGLLMLAEVTVFGLLAQVFLVMGLQRETAGRGTMALYTQIIFASAFEFVLFGTLPSILSVAGTSIIISSALWVALSTDSTAKQEQRPLLEGRPRYAEA